MIIIINSDGDADDDKGESIIRKIRISSEGKIDKFLILGGERREIFSKTLWSL